MIDAPVKEIMTTPVVAMKSHVALVDACNIMYENRFSCLVVTDENKPVGIITERDIVRVLIDFLETNPWKTANLKTFMTAKPLCLSQETTVSETLEIMLQKGIRHVPVVDDDGELTGLVTYSDLIRNNQVFLEKQDELIAKSVEEQTRDLARKNEQLREMTLEDPLLKVGNRRAMEHDLHYALETSRRYGTIFTVVLLDVDYFKKYNDKYGHKKGDEVLQFIASYLKRSIRGTDRIYRYGGEEFLLLLSETGIDGSEILLNRIISELGILNVRHEGSPFGFITVSCGLAGEEPETHSDSSWEQLVNRADQALYMAKEQGRNQLVISFGDDDFASDRLGIAI